MRTTTHELDPMMEQFLEDFAQDAKVVKDKTITQDFIKDLYSLFENPDARSKTPSEISREVYWLYTSYGVKDYRQSVLFYIRILNFMNRLRTSRLYQTLSKEMEPIDAVAFIMEMFNPPIDPKEQGQNQPQSGEGQGQGTPQPQPASAQPAQPGDGDEEAEGVGKGEFVDNRSGNPDDYKITEHDDYHNTPSGQENLETHGQDHKRSEDQHGTSADSESLPVDMDMFEELFPQAENLMSTGIFDDSADGHDAREVLEKTLRGAGVGHNDIRFLNLPQLVKKLGNVLSKKEMTIFRIARNHRMVSKYKRGEELVDTEVMEDEMFTRPMNNLSEITKLMPSQLAMPDDLFYHKMAKNELVVRQFQERRMKAQVLYILIDVSGSMSGDGVSHLYASGVALSLVRQAVDESCQYYLRFFDQGVHDLLEATSREQAKNICDRLIKAPYSGGGTDINRAISVAVKDITEDKSKYDKAEILLITDGEDRVNPDRARLNGVKLNSFVINGENQSLRELSDTYSFVDRKEMNKLVQT